MLHKPILGNRKCHCWYSWFWKASLSELLHEWMICPETLYSTSPSQCNFIFLWLSQRYSSISKPLDKKCFIALTALCATLLYSFVITVGDPHTEEGKLGLQRGHWPKVLQLMGWLWWKKTREAEEWEGGEIR